MEATTQDAYLDSPSSRQESSHDSPATHCGIPPASACSQATIKSHGTEPPAYTNVPCLYSPSVPYHSSSPTSPNAPYDPPSQQLLTFHVPTNADYIASMTPSNRPSYSDDEDDEDVPLAYLPLYPRDAPPAYSTIVQQLYRETLLQHIPCHPVVMEMDEEAGLESLRADDVRFKVEQVVATAVVMALLVLAGVLLGLLFLRN